MRINLNPVDSPDNFLDIYPENDDDSVMLLDFRSIFPSSKDVSRIDIVVITKDGILNNRLPDNYQDISRIVITVK